MKQSYDWLLRVVRRPEQSKGFDKLPVRWRVERSFGSLLPADRRVFHCRVARLGLANC